MLKYLISTTKTLLSMALLVGLMLSYLKQTRGERSKISMLAGTIAGVLSAAVMAYMKNATNKIDTSLWNLRIFILWLAALVLFAVFSALGKRTGKAGEVVPAVLLALMAGLALFYALPDVLANPYTIQMTEKSVLSTSYLFKLIGTLLGVVLTAVAGIALYQQGKRLSVGELRLFLWLGLAVEALRQMANVLRIMLTKRMIPSNHTVFTIVKFTSNYSDLFIYLTMAVGLALCAVLLLRSTHVNEPYSNPAEHRKIRAKWRSIRRWAATALACLVLSVFTMTAVNAYANKGVELSPVEQADVVDGNVVVPFEAVEDGHLHRFGYTSENGVEIRFIVIQKPNSSSYGIGLDACDICGETGYYEKDGQVVCKLCDVVMNINTIGFKGGCNPIVIQYAIENGQILVPVDGLLAYEDEFK